MPDRKTPYTVAGEKETLIDFLDYLRESIIIKATGLSEEDVRKRLVQSDTTLLWLVKHMVGVEMAWFQRSFMGRDVDIPDDAVTSEDTAESAITAYREAIRESDKIIAEHDDLDQLAAAPRKGNQQSLRWMLIHMVEETARHAGHADILREQIDGETGR
jgi:uncharacterized damage-inducible protein DinB